MGCGISLTRVRVGVSDRDTSYLYIVTGSGLAHKKMATHQSVKRHRMYHDGDALMPLVLTLVSGGAFAPLNMHRVHLPHGKGESTFFIVPASHSSNPIHFQGQHTAEVDYA